MPVCVEIWRSRVSAIEKASNERCQMTQFSVLSCAFTTSEKLGDSLTDSEWTTLHTTAPLKRFGRYKHDSTRAIFLAEGRKKGISTSLGRIVWREVAIIGIKPSLRITTNYWCEATFLNSTWTLTRFHNAECANGNKLSFYYELFSAVLPLCSRH